MSDPVIIVVALLVAGYVLMAMEIFVVPGFGVAGISGLLCLAAGCYSSFAYYGTTYGTLTVLLVLGSTTAVFLWIPRSRVGRNIVHSSSLSKARAGESELAPDQLGIAESDLRPAGIARFGELRQSVVTEGEFIASGTSIQITEIRGSRIVVEAAPDDRSAKLEGDGPLKEVK
jgi:membrane-bound serine protease (ClpP class)